MKRLFALAFLALSLVLVPARGAGLSQAPTAPAPLPTPAPAPDPNAPQVAGPSQIGTPTGPWKASSGVWIKKSRGYVRGWSWNAFWLESVAFLIVVLGLLIGSMPSLFPQTAARDANGPVRDGDGAAAPGAPAPAAQTGGASPQAARLRVATLLLGFAVSVLTALGNITAPVDYKTLNLAVADGNIVLDAAEQAVNSLPDTVLRTDFDSAARSLTASQTQFGTIYERANGKGKGGATPASEGFFVLGKVFAQAQQTCSGRASDDTFVYFYYQVADTSLEKAGDVANTINRNQAAYWLRDAQGATVHDAVDKHLSDLVSSSASMSGSSYTYSPTVRAYIYCSVLRLPISLKSLDISGLDPSNVLGHGLGPYTLGTSTAQVNSELPTPFGSTTNLPAAGEFQGDMRYFWVYTRTLKASDLAALKPFAACAQAQNTYMTFFFAEDRLVRIAVRYFSDCTFAANEGLSFASSYYLSPAGPPDGVTSDPANKWYRRTLLSGTTIEEKIQPNGGVQINLYTSDCPKLKHDIDF